MAASRVENVIVPEIRFYESLTNKRKSRNMKQSPLGIQAKDVNCSRVWLPVVRRVTLAGRINCIGHNELNEWFLTTMVQHTLGSITSTSNYFNNFPLESNISISDFYNSHLLSSQLASIWYQKFSRSLHTFGLGWYIVIYMVRYTLLRHMYTIDLNSFWIIDL